MYHTGHTGKPLQLGKVVVIKCDTALVKAFMKSYIPLKTAAKYVLANLFLKQGISLEYDMVDFICMG